MEREAFIIGFSLFDVPGVQERWDELHKQIVELTAQLRDPGRHNLTQPVSHA